MISAETACTRALQLRGSLIGARDACALQ